MRMGVIFVMVWSVTVTVTVPLLRVVVTVIVPTSRNRMVLRMVVVMPVAVVRLGGCGDGRSADNKCENCGFHV